MFDLPLIRENEDVLLKQQVNIDVDDMIDNSLLKDKLKNAILKLNKLEQKVLNDLYNLDDEDDSDRCVASTAKKLGFTYQYVRKIEKNALKKLRVILTR